MTHLFTYPDFGSPSGYPDHVAHSGQTCEVVRALGADERDAEVGPMFVVRFPDGVELTVFGSELDPHPPVTPGIWALDTDSAGAVIYCEGMSPTKHGWFCIEVEPGIDWRAILTRDLGFTDDQVNTALATTTTTTQGE